MDELLTEVKSLPGLIKQSTKALHDVKELVGTALFVALDCVLGFFKIVIIPKTLEIGFSSLAMAGCSFLYGPVISGFAGVICDTLKYILNPSGAYMPLFTLNEFLLGFIYGIFFYRKEITLKRVIVARIVVVLLINLTLTPLWLHLLYGKAYIFYVQVRILKNLLMLPFDVFLLYTVLKTVSKLQKK